MPYEGTITEVRHSRAGVTFIIDTEMGLRGVEVERELLAAILDDFELSRDDDLIGWTVTYDPARGDLDIIMPDDESDAELQDPQAGTDDRESGQ